MSQTAALSLFFGPDRIPFVLGRDASVFCALATPFHGIVSRGLLPALSGPDTPPELWNRRAHRLLDEPEDGDPDAAALAAAARSGGVLSFGHSALAARIYVERYCETTLKGDVRACALWNIKEGRTSSVWHASIATASGAACPDFIVNVARDREAGGELEAASRRMQSLKTMEPDINLAGVLEIATIRIDFPGEPIDVVVTRNEFVAEAFEVHSARDRGTGIDVLVLVERFLTSDERPATIASIRGRHLTPDECRRIEQDVERFVNAASRHRIEARVDLNDGDVVWNGQRAIVVALG